MRRETGQIAPKTTRKRIPKLHAWPEWLLARIEARPEIYLHELQTDLKRELCETTSRGTLCFACAELERTRNKRRSSRPSKIVPTSSNAARNGARRKLSIRTDSNFSTKLGRKQT